MLTRTLAFITTLAAALAVFFGVRSKQHQAEAERDRQRAEVAEAANATHQRINDDLSKTAQRHRQEQQTDEERLAKGGRDHFENRW